ncbi:MAG: MFS transporter [Calditrichaceae bacterium]|nr:MFS transporter [Calditrichaceae bacterium]MBN2710178.1 MFS transporter [Calditrichaceae bacterium]RQV94153.1 MAG: MFS transporter [Calditrichota bacterium]
MNGENQSATNMVAKDRIPASTKFSYGLGTALDMWGFWLYPAVAFAVFNIYLGVEPWLVGLALTVIRLYDAVSDPVAGWISDNFRSKFGRRRPFILVFGILGGLGLPLLFFVSPSWINVTFLGASVLFWYMIVSSVIYIPIMSIYTVPYNSLGAEMSPDYDERTSIMTYRSTMQKFFEVGNFYALRFTNLSWFLLPEVGKKNTLLGIQVYTAILGAMMIIFAVIIFIRVKERYYDKVVVKIKEHISIKSSLYETLKNRPFRIMMGVGASFTLGTSMVGSLGYYATVYYVCAGNTIDGDNWNFWMGIAFMIGGLLGAPILGKVARFIDKKHSVMVAACIGMIGYGGSWFLYTPLIPWLQTIASGIMAFAASGLWMLHGSIGADIIDHDELNTGKRREGSFTACGSYILKLGNSLGYFVSGLILGWAGFDSNVMVQTPDTIFWIRAMLAGIPVAGLIAVILFVSRLELTKQKCAEIRITLEQRRGTV